MLLKSGKMFCMDKQKNKKKLIVWDKRDRAL